MKKVTVVVPVYNVEKYLARCIESIRKQSYQNFELILVDDGSSDASGQICDEYQLKDDRINVIHKENEGAGEARNAGIDMAQGTYITFIDSDDYIAPCYLERMVNTAEETHCEIVQCNFLFGPEEEFPFEKEMQNDCKAEILDNHQVFFTRAAKIIICAKIYRRELFEGIRYPKVSVHDDEFITYKLLYRAKKTAILPVAYYYYYKSENSIMREKKEYYPDNFIQAFDERISFFEEMQEKDLVIASYKEKCVRLMLFYCQCYGEPGNKNDKEAILTMYQADYKEACKMKMVSKEKIILELFNRCPKMTAKIVKMMRR